MGSKQYKLAKYDGKCTMKAQYIGINSLRDIKNKFAKEDILLLTAYYREKFEKDAMPLHLTIFSAPVKISTEGRFDDNADFGHPLRAIFHLNYIHMIARFLPDVTQDETAAYIKYFKQQICLAYIDYDEKEFKCINRLPLEVKKTAQSGGRGLTNKRLTVMYKVPRPGTYVVILKPIKGLAKQAFAKHEIMTNSLLRFKANSFIAPVAVILVIAMIVSIFWCIGLNENIKATELENQILTYKLKQIDGVLPDFPEQTPMEKLNSYVRFFKNPAWALNDFDELREAYKEYEKERAEHDEKRLEQNKQKGLRRKLKINQEYAKQVDEFEDETQLLEHAVEKYSHIMTKYQGFLLQKTRYERFLQNRLKRNGRSLKGSATIEIFVPDESEGDEDNEVKADNGGDAGEQEAYPQPPVEEEVGEAPVEEAPAEEVVEE